MYMHTTITTYTVDVVRCCFLASVYVCKFSWISTHYELLPVLIVRLSNFHMLKRYKWKTINFNIVQKSLPHKTKIPGYG